MGISIAAASTLVAGLTAGVAVVAVAKDTASVDIWTLLEKGGAPMAGVLLLALIEVVRRHDRKDKIIEAKDATILELSNRQTSAIETTNEIANDQIKIARDTQSLLKELVTLARGKPDIG